MEKIKICCTVILSAFLCISGCATNAKVSEKLVSQNLSKKTDVVKDVDKNESASELGAGSIANTESKVETKPVTESEIPIAKMKTSQIQKALKSAGYYEDKVDGIPGPKTREAIRRFQIDNGLMADSVAGPRTQRILAKYLEKENNSEEK